VIVLTAAARIQWSGPLAESIVLAMSSLKALALTVVSSCALLATDGCGKSGGKGATSDAAPGDATGADAATVGSGGAGGTGGGKDASFGGTGGVSMTGGAAGGRGGTIGAGGSSASSCPQAAPANGAVCYQEDQCFYEDCATSGRTVAICVGKSWQVTAGACTSLSCYGAGARGSVQITCPQGQICLATYGKDPVCVSQTCGTGPVTAGCVADAAGFCEIHGTAAVGITLLCCLTAGTSC
jgi:hypothetical protein